MNVDNENGEKRVEGKLTSQQSGTLYFRSHDYSVVTVAVIGYPAAFTIFLHYLSVL
jgi:hypothetical protein